MVGFHAPRKWQPIGRMAAFLPSARATSLEHWHREFLNVRAIDKQRQEVTLLSTD
jgi:hypothetical protein